MKPLILDFKEKRQDTNVDFIYQYDIESKVNTVTVNGEKKAFIDLETTDLELLTKTRVNRERDDDHFLFELGTKTEVRRERDDHNNIFLELATKTFTTRERDDTKNSFLENTHKGKYFETQN
ncbi:MAG TPA: hypothetical protein VMU83_21865 [Hanamia sp.]|nr:hypothetical protein [Hanamia sp.]